jgi:hypothetical protein
MKKKGNPSARQASSSDNLAVAPATVPVAVYNELIRKYQLVTNTTETPVAACNQADAPLVLAPKERGTVSPSLHLLIVEIPQAISSESGVGVSRTVAPEPVAEMSGSHTSTLVSTPPPDEQNESTSGSGTKKPKTAKTTAVTASKLLRQAFNVTDSKSQDYSDFRVHRL